MRRDEAEQEHGKGRRHRNGPKEAEIQGKAKLSNHGVVGLEPERLDAGQIENYRKIQASVATFGRISRKCVLS